MKAERVENNQCKIVQEFLLSLNSPPNWVTKQDKIFVRAGRTFPVVACSEKKNIHQCNCTSSNECFHMQIFLISHDNSI